MASGVISEAVLVNLADPRYFQHGGNLMVSDIFLFQRKKYHRSLFYSDKFSEK